MKKLHILHIILLFALSIHAQNWTQITKAVASDRAEDDRFGCKVAISGDYAIVGAFLEDEDASGGNTASSAGSAYIFKNIAGIWTQIQKVVASDRNGSANFGSSVDINGDYAIIGAPNEDYDASGSNYIINPGVAYIFKNISGTWTEIKKIVASDRARDEFFGNSVSISDNYAIVGAYQEDISTSYTTNEGAAYIFTNNLDSWTQLQKIVSSDRASADFFGISVSISGDYIIIGAHYESEDVLGANSLSNAGSAYLFKNNAGTWSQVQKIVAGDRDTYDQFGVSVSISGDYAIIGAQTEDHDVSGTNLLSNAGSAYIFKNNSGTWSQIQKIVANDRGAGDAFGFSVSISGDYAFIGACYEDENASGSATLSAAGSAYIFKNNTGTWAQFQKIVSSDRAIDDYFGYSVAISGDNAISGAYYEDHDASGQNYLWAAGSSYIFSNSTTWNGSTWSNGTPTSSQSANVDGDLTISTGLSANNFTIYPGADVTINSSQTLTVAGDFIINSDATSTGSYINNSGTLTVTGDKTVQRYVDGGTNGYVHYVSPSISDATAADLLDENLGDYNVYKYVPGGSPVWSRVFSSTSLGAGSGYCVAYDNNKTIVFSGTLNDGNVNVTVSNSGTAYNLVGNPYPSRLDADAFVTDGDNSEISGAIYYWADDHTAGSGYSTADYATWTTTGSTGSSGGGTSTAANDYVEVGQGFFVLASSAGTLIFKNSHRVHTASADFYTPAINEVQRLWLKLTNNEYDYSNDILIGFLEEATNDYDRLYDAVKNQGNENLSFYSIIENDDRNFVIQGLPIPTSEKEIKLGYFAKQAGIYTIDIDNMERFDGYSIVLVDKEMNITVNLLETDYSFTTASGEFDERFSLFISAKSSSVEEANQDVKIYSSENLIYLNIPQDENYCISVYDMLGKKVYSSIPSSIGFQSIDLGLKTGFYLVKVKNETSEYTEKVFLK